MCNRSLALKTGLVIFLLTAISPGVAAKLIEQEIFSPERGASAQALLETSRGEFLVMAQVMHKQPGNWEQRPAILHFDAGRRFIGEIAIPPAVTAVQPFGRNYLGLTASPPENQEQRRYRVIAFDRTGKILQTLYEASAGTMEVRFAPATDQRAVYVVETLPGFRLSLRRVGAGGGIEWQKDFEERSFSELAATANGVALLCQPYSYRAPIVVSAVSASGKLLWETAVPSPPGILTYQFAALPPDRIVVRRVIQGEPQRLTILDAADGSKQGDVTIPPADAMRPTPQGLLLRGNLANYPYLALVDRNGALQWWRRFRIHNDLGALTDATITRSGKLLVLGSYIVEQTPHFSEFPSVTLIESNPDGQELVDAYGRCLDVDPRAILTLQGALEKKHAVSASAAPDRATQSLPINGRECGRPTDSEYLAFLQALSASLPPPQKPVEPWNMRIYASVVADDADARLVRYSFDTPVMDAPRTSFAFEVSAREAVLLQRKVATVLWPHLEIMQGYQQQFSELTGYSFSVSMNERQTLADPELFAKLESSARRLLDVISALPADELRQMRENHRANVYPLLAPDLFGTYQELRPLDAATSTLAEMISQGTQRRRRNN
jgi:hypothetical protein